MKNELLSHYNNLAGSYDELWFYSNEFVSVLSEEIIDILKLKNKDKLVDLGCGTGIYSKAILERISLSENIICSDISSEMVKNLRGYDKIDVSVSDALEFSKAEISYDKIFVKEMIHHVKNKEELFSNIYRQLKKNGIFLILLLPPTIEYPLFSKALELYEKSQPHYNVLSDLLQQVGFEIEIKTISIPLSIEKKKYFDMIKKRYMSLLSAFGDSEIESGLIELKKRFAEQSILNFNDNFIALVGKK